MSFTELTDIDLRFLIHTHKKNMQRTGIVIIKMSAQEVLAILIDEGVFLSKDSS